MRWFLTVIVVVLALLLVVTLGLFMPRLSQRVTQKTPPPHNTISSSENTVTTTESDISRSEKLLVDIYLVALGDDSVSGRKIGCGDSVVAVKREIPKTTGTLKAALNELLSLKDKYYGESGLYNALSSSSLSIENIQIKGDIASVYLTGKLSLGGICDNPRVEEQLKSTALQFPTITKVNFFLNNTPLHEALSEK